VNVEDAYRAAFSRVVEDFLSVEARGHRKVLMLLSGLAIVVWAADVQPTRISTLGVDLAPNETSRLYVALLVVIIYFLLTFLVYAYNDLLRLRDTRFTARQAHKFAKPYLERHARALADKRRSPGTGSQQERDEIRQAIEQYEHEIESWTSLGTLLSVAGRVGRIRVMADFVVPVVMAVLGLVAASRLV
jgi:hypothetical protein